MNMKRLILAVTTGAFLLFGAGYLLANGTDKGSKFEKRMEHRIEKMQKKLNLSDQQVAQAKQIIADAKPQMQADWKRMKDAPKDQKEAIRAEVKKDREATKEKLLAILTPDQRAKAEKFFKHHEEHDEKK